MVRATGPDRAAGRCRGDDRSALPRRRDRRARPSRGEIAMARRLPIAASAAAGEFERTGPGTLAGRYLRRFWHPVYHTADLAPGRAVPLRIMGQDFVLYRGEGGAAHLLDPRCPHRGTQ